MNYSVTYLFTFLLAGLGLENAEGVAEALVTVAVAIGVLWGRYRAGGVKPWGGK